MAETIDPYIGEIYEDRDTRTAGRRIKIISTAPSTQFYGQGYYYRRVDIYGQFVGPANRVRISPETLARTYRKVSH